MGTTTLRAKKKANPVIWVAALIIVLVLAVVSVAFNLYQKPLAQLYSWAARATALLGSRQIAFWAADRAARLDPENVEYMNKRCWYGAVAGYGKDVYADCERTVELKPGRLWAVDSRGVGRAAIGDYEGAIADFEFNINLARQQNCCEGYIRERQKFIDAMKAGNDPLDEEALRSLLRQ